LSKYTKHGMFKYIKITPLLKIRLQISNIDNLIYYQIYLFRVTVILEIFREIAKNLHKSEAYPEKDH